MKKIFKSLFFVLFVSMCAATSFAQQTTSDSTSAADTPADSTTSDSATASDQSPSESVVATPTTTLATKTPDAQAVSPAQPSEPAAAPVPAAAPAAQPAVAAQPQPAQTTQADDESLQPIQKDDKKSLTVMTSDIPGKDIAKKDWLSDMFTPVGDFTYDVIKTTSDALGGFCQGCVNAFDGITKSMLTPFGFKDQKSEKRSYFS